MKKNIKILCKEHFEIKILRNTREAILLDKENNATLWAETITKERIALEKYSIFMKIPLDYK